MLLKVRGAWIKWRTVFLRTTASLRVRILTKKLPSPQAGSKNRLSMHSVLSFTRLYIVFALRSAVNAMPCITRTFLIWFAGSLILLSLRMGKHYCNSYGRCKGYRAKTRKSCCNVFANPLIHSSSIDLGFSESKGSYKI